jgi:hypothetical protein
MLAGAGALSSLAPFVAASISGLAGFIVVGGLVKLASLVIGIGLYAAIVGAAAGAIAGILGFCLVYVWTILVSPVVMMENRGLRAAFSRSRLLSKRAFATVLGAVVIVFLMPMLLAGSLSYVVNISAKAFELVPKKEPAPVEEQIPSGSTENGKAPEALEEKQIDFSFGRTSGINIDTAGKAPMDMRERVTHTVLESLIHLFWMPLNIFVLSFSGIIVALLYLKPRLAGGESMHVLLETFQDHEKPPKKWQERVRNRLIQSGRIPSKP